MFPDEYYRQLFKLRGWQYSPMSTKRPSLDGKLTNQIVYEKLPPGVLEELKKQNPTITSTKRRKWKHFQFLSDDIGQPDLRNHLLQVIALMRAASNWRTFMSMFKKSFPSPEEGEQQELQFPERKEAQNR